MHNYLLIFFFSLAVFVPPAHGQDTAKKILKERGEVYIIFPKPSLAVIHHLSGKIFIDNVRKDSVIACVNEKGYRYFLKQNIPFRLYFYPVPKDLATARTAKGLDTWSSYPTYEQYDSVMHRFASNHPDICLLDTIGSSVQGRLLLAVKISDSVATDENEPEFFYTSTMHGDETGGYVMLLHLIDYLLSNYQTDSTATTLINNMEIWINPLANPDGTYHGGNETVSGATRLNADGLDLNRNFPDPVEGPHPDNNDYAVENIAMMQFMQHRHFIMSANFHAGAEVVNYPWDSWTSSEKTHADDSWFRFISREYADTAHNYSPAGYMTDLENGITNGGDWYQISGGRQDYVTYFLHGRETTIELDNTKITPAGDLLALWQSNFHSLLNYMHEALYGIAGKISDSLTGVPLRAKIEIPGHDIDSSWVWSDSVSGSFYRLLDSGAYTLRVSAPGYQTKVFPGITITRHHQIYLNISLAPLSSNKNNYPSSSLNIYPNPVITGSQVTVSWPGNEEVTISFIAIDGRMERLIKASFRQGDNRIMLPQGLTGMCFITIEGRKYGPLTGKIIILP